MYPFFSNTQALEEGRGVDYVHNLTKIDNWFLHKLQRIVDIQADVKGYKG